MAAEEVVAESENNQPVEEKGLEVAAEEVVAEVEPEPAPWDVIDIDRGDTVSASYEGSNGNSSPNSVVFEVAPELTPITEAEAEASLNSPSVERGLEPLDEGPSDSSVIGTRLSHSHPSERAAALADLAELSSEDSFALIARSFDDPAADVRNAAARALYDLHPDRAASFTRALREASPERRRMIGAAIAGSGLAANAINNLSGDGREKTYDAFSILFLMAKAGEVQPLIQAISKHSNIEVRLTVIKVLAFSNQPQVLSAFRNLAAREQLTPEVHAAVMEAIYLLSSQARENAPSVA